MSEPDNMETKPALLGTCKYYERHLFICTGRVAWPAKIELGGGFPQALAEAMAPNLDQMPLKVKMTACDEPSTDPNADGHDILVFPDGIRYLGVRISDLPALIDDHLVGNEISGRLPHQQLAGWHIFVCVHAGRDARCGACGPPVATRFLTELSERGLQDHVKLRRTSHVGGHVYAGNVLIYPGGDWYGYVSPDQVPRIIDQHIVAGKPVVDLWRGRMGLDPAQQVIKANSLLEPL